MLQGSKNKRYNNTGKYNCVINHISLCLAVLKGRKKFHEASSHKVRYKTALPFLEIGFRQNKVYKYFKIGKYDSYNGVI